MRIQVNPDFKACVIAGVEPATSVEIDLTSLTPNDRMGLSKYLDGDKLLFSAVPEMSAILAEVHRREAAKTEESRQRADKEAAQIAEGRAVIAERREYQRTAYTCNISYTVRSIEWPYGTSVSWMRSIAPDVVPALDAWEAEIKAANDAAKAAAEAENIRITLAAEAEKQQAITERARLAREGWVDAAGLVLGLITPDKLSVPITDLIAIREDSGLPVLLETSQKFGELTLLVTIDSKESIRRLGTADKSWPSSRHSIHDGVVGGLGYASGNWAAVSAPGKKPDYQFLPRVPGGFDASSVRIGDIFVMGGTDKKGRKGRTEYVVYEIGSDYLRAVRCADWQEVVQVHKLVNE